MKRGFADFLRSRAALFTDLGIETPKASSAGPSSRFCTLFDNWERPEEPIRAESRADGLELEIAIMDVIGGWWGGVDAAMVKSALDGAPKAKLVRALINSPGGDVFEGLAIANLLKRHSARVEVEVLGYAASAASVVAMAGDDIAMHEGTFMMIHKAWTFMIGDDEDLRHEADVLTKINNALIDLYARRTAGDRDEIAKLVADETWMDATESQTRGFADRIIPGKAPAENSAKKRKYEGGEKSKAEFKRDPYTRRTGDRAEMEWEDVIEAQAELNRGESTTTTTAAPSPPAPVPAPLTALAGLRDSGLRSDLRRL